MVSGARGGVLRALAGAALAAALAGPAAAEPTGLERARAELGDLRYAEAAATLDAALTAGTSGPVDTAQIYLLLGEVRASLDQDEAAQRAFERALSLDPGLKLRKGVSPKIGRPFRRAVRARRGFEPLSIAHREIEQQPTRIAVVVRSDRLAMVAAARVTAWESDGPPRTLSAEGKRGAPPDGDPGEIQFEIELPPGSSRITVAGVDEHGNRLVELGSADKPIALAVPPPAPPVEPAPPVTIIADSRESRPFYAHWLVWGGVAVAAGAVGVWAGLSAQSAVDELDEIRGTVYEVEFRRARRIADRAERRSLIANVCFAGAGAAAIVSGILLLQSRPNDSGERAAVAPVIGPDQVGVAAWLRF
jgi:hypothetical protein